MELVTSHLNIFLNDLPATCSWRVKVPLAGWVSTLEGLLDTWLQITVRSEQDSPFKQVSLYTHSHAHLNLPPTKNGFFKSLGQKKFEVKHFVACLLLPVLLVRT